MILIKDDTLTEYNLNLLKDFETNVYLNAFPDNEREEFSDIIRRIQNINKWEPQTFIILKMEGDEVVGGVVADWYSSCCVLEIIYITLKFSYRGKGKGYQMLWGSIEKIKECVGDIQNIFIEVEKIHNRPLIGDEMDSRKRLEFWKRCGAIEIPINYVQPPLSEGKKELNDLLLMGMPLNEGDKVVFKKNILIEFLKEFYKGLGYTESEYLSNMLNEIELIKFD